MEIIDVTAYLKCIKCKEIPLNPLTTKCCGLIYCDICEKSPLIQCNECQRPTKLKQSISIKRILKFIPTKCKFCSVGTYMSTLKQHYDACPLYPIACKLCKTDLVQKDLLSHISEHHQQFIIDKIYNEQQFDSILNLEINQLGRKTKLGPNGKHYCGGELDIPCSCCNGRCGPTNGCNCTACLKLDCKTRGLDGRHFVNKDGAICKITNIGIYCGRQVMDGVFGCDGYCGPTNGPNCNSCKIFQSKYRMIAERFKLLADS